MFKILGLTDDFTTCECCGRAGLKNTVALAVCDSDGNITGETVHYGRDCAATAILGNKKSASVKVVEMTAKGIAYCKKWLHKTPSHTAAVVGRGCLVFCPCHVIGESIVFQNGVTVE